MRRLLGYCGVLSFAAQSLAAQVPVNAPQVYLLTMGVGEHIEARFGHNAILIRDTTTQQELVYNFGTYDFNAPGFVWHFIQGRPQYHLAVVPLAHTIGEYSHYQRSIVAQELALSPSQRAEIAFLLAENAKPENRAYGYDYYLDNCSTRVRDLLDMVLGGELSRATSGVPAAGNLRFHTQRSITNDLFMYLGIMALMGPSTDAPLDQWGEMFLPEKVHERVGALHIPDTGGGSHPLVTREFTILEMNRYAAVPTPPAWEWRFFGVGALLGILILTGAWVGSAGMAGRVLARLWLVLVGVAGVIVLFVWLGTNHLAAADNRNLLILSPLALLLLPQVSPRPRPDGRGPRFLRWAFAGSVGVGLFLAIVPAIGVQWNLQLAALMVPPSVAVLWLMARRPAAAPGSHQKIPAQP